MKYVALLRGINVGGNNKVEMRRLKACFEAEGMKEVKTYINSGNVIFSSSEISADKLVTLLEKALAKEFGFTVKIVIRTVKQLEKIVQELPAEWKNDEQTKCDVLFLWEAIDKPSLLDELGIKPELEEVKYVTGAVLWCIPRQNVTRSGLMKLVGTKMYAQMTIRNCNTVRKLYELMREN